MQAALPPAPPLLPSQRGPALAGVLVAHLLLGWALLQSPSVRQAVTRAVPLMVTLVVEAPEAPPPPQAPKPPGPKPAPAPSTTPRPETHRTTAAPTPMPTLPAPSPAPPPASAETPAPPAALAAPPSESSPAAAPAPPAVPAPPPAVPSLRVLTGSAVRYLVPPPLEVPLASRRLNEAGTVLLKVLVGSDGLPRRISVHKSSGHARLDDAALAAMAQARFKPLMEDGVATECIVLAPLQFELD